MKFSKIRLAIIIIAVIAIVALVLITIFVLFPKYSEENAPPPIVTESYVAKTSTNEKQDVLSDFVSSYINAELGL